jgi:hypothetical protein
LAFYFDHVDQSNQGKSYGYFFFLKKNYWFGSSKEDLKKIKDNLILTNKNNEFETSSFLSGNNINSNTEQKLLNEKNENEENKIMIDNQLKGVVEEKQKILRSIKGENELSGLKILGCGKTYNINNGICSTKKLHALKEVN